MFENREYLIIPSTEVPKVNFLQVCETSAETLRFSVDQTKTFIKWDGEQPEFISNLLNTEGPYSYSEILDILGSLEWYNPLSIVE